MPYRLAALGFAAALALPSAGSAQEPAQRLKLELNSATDTTDGACQLTYVIENDSGTALDQTAYTVVAFDADGVVLRFLNLPFGALVEGKTYVVRFNLPGTTCDGISRMVVNDSSACVDANTGAETDLCMSALSASSRTQIEFGI